VRDTHRPQGGERLALGDRQPFVWTATADEILAKVRWVERNVNRSCSAMTGG
jgi:hypothetical protein